MKNSLFLTSVLLIHFSNALLSNPAAPFSYVASLDMQSYHFAPSLGGGPLSGAFNVTLTYTDTFPNPPVTGLILGGFQTSGSSEVGFTISAYSGGNAYSAIFQLTLLATTSLDYISFFFVMVGATTISTQHFSIIPVTRSSLNLVSTGSAIQTPEASISRPSNFSSAQYNYYIQSFKVNCLTSPDCYVAVKDASTTAASFNYTLETDANNILDQVVFNIFVFIPSAPYIPPAYYTYTFTTLEFSDLIIAVYTDTQGNGFSNNFNGKCLLGSNSFKFEAASFSLIYDMNNDYSTIIANPNYVNTTSLGVIKLTMFCFMQKYNCSNIDIHCTKCLTQSTTVPACSDCLNAYYASGGICLPCNTPLVGCTHCENDTVCLACNVPLYYYDSVAGVCLDCLTFLVACQVCSSITNCNSCISGYGLNSSTSCLPCGILMSNCQLCTTKTYCTSCLDGYYVNFTHKCAPCSIIPNCATCLDSNTCLTCNTDFQIDPNTNSCVCNPGFIYISGYCTTIGCISAYKFGTTVTCLACDTSKHYQLANNLCGCQTGFTLTTTNCSEICGDGLVFYASCDDGNLVNGDGCSNKCQVEANYQCFNGTSTSASACLYITPLHPAIQNILKTPDSNQMQIDITVNKNAPLDLTQIANYITLTIGATIITNFDVSFDSKSGKATFTVPYTSSIEGQEVVIDFGYDPTIFKLSTDTLTFSAKGSNMALLYESQANGYESIVQNIGYAIASLALLQLLVSAAFHRIIGMETFQVTQIVFFTRYLVAESNSATFQALSTLKYIDFYNIFSNYPNVYSLSGEMIRMGFTKSFVFNVLIQIFLIAVAWILFGIFNSKYMRLKRMNMSDGGTLLQLFKKYKSLSYVFSNYIFTLTTSTFLVLVFSYLSCTQPQSDAVVSLPTEMMGINIVLIGYATIYICAQVYSNFKESRRYNEEEGCYYRYLTIFLFYYMGLGVMTVGGGNGLISKFILVSIQIMYFLGIIYYRPYLITMHNVSLIINQIVVLIFTALMILNDVTDTLHNFRGYILIGVELFLLVVNVLGWVRIYVHQKYNVKAFQKAKVDADKAKGIIKQEFKLSDIDKNKKLSNTFHKSIFEKQKEMKEKEETALQKLKNRLKQEFKDKTEEEKNALLDHDRS